MDPLAAGGHAGRRGLRNRAYYATWCDAYAHRTPRRGAVTAPANWAGKPRPYENVICRPCCSSRIRDPTPTQRDPTLRRL